MLVLTRNPGESILIGGEIEIILIDVHGKEVSFEIIAPKTNHPHRKETWRPDVPIPISDDISLQIVSVRGHKVRLGITAPGNVCIVRKEWQQSSDNGTPLESE